jgi:hypothetical protein
VKSDIASASPAGIHDPLIDLTFCNLFAPLTRPDIEQM